MLTRTAFTSRAAACLTLPPVSLRRVKHAQRMTTANAIVAHVKGRSDDPTQLGDCPFCHRTLLTLELKGLDYKKELIDFNNKPDWLFEVNKEGKVPIIKDGDKWVPDSGDICTYLDEKYPDPSLGKPSIEGVAEKLLPTFKQFLQCSDEEVPEKEAAFLEQIEQLDTYLASNGPFLNGEKMGAADALMVPRLYHAATALPRMKNYNIPDKYQHVWKYLVAAKQTEAFKNTDYGEDAIVAGWSAHS